MQVYRRDMQPFPGLESYRRSLHLPALDLDLFYYEAGSASLPPALLVHGLGDEADTWHSLIEPLARRWHVIAPDLPGFGRSDKPKVAYTADFMQRALLELVETLALEAPILCGHSLGANLVHRLALARPDRYRGLVLMSGSLFMKTSGVSLSVLLYLVPGLGEWLYNRLRKDPQAAYDTLKIYYADIEKLPAVDREFLFRRVNERVWSDDQRRAYFSTLRNFALEATRAPNELMEKLAGFSIPTLLFWGECDAVYTAASGQELAGVQPGLKLVIIPGMGHNIQQEAPLAILAELEQM